ncbi:MAG: hypothetical protein GF417_12045 [Candidatus Latescibacteria bacterium]|nr:hypothetical protein [Candidatus Latescibacterota bacterium]
MESAESPPIMEAGNSILGPWLFTGLEIEEQGGACYYKPFIHLHDKF